MKEPCYNCLVMPICINKSLKNTISKCVYLKEYLIELSLKYEGNNLVYKISSLKKQVVIQYGDSSKRIIWCYEIFHGPYIHIPLLGFQ